ncbi:hypothetical protein LV457_13135 [Mycobacterium sp. MYCO198283]|uniref:hypothetical protein n=1 Tax=Mycobacterium sp. MYCO198283 TaxID=2883505 RepID=UPI001E41C017|nr:hypothetical protein [Mycobacterium sp. MYCO198283]MCG5433222.1 hypothetical protein [Mycobacterium sp. MYCO198283]
MTRVRFTGRIGGVGTSSGVRMVIGSWAVSPFGSFTDAMVQSADGRRTLVAPTDEVAEFVAATYHFDQVVVQPVDAVLTGDALTVDAEDLRVVLRIGGPGPFDRLLRLVPPPLSRAPRWLRAIDPVASWLVPGVHTAGTAGNGRREYYGVRRTRLITGVSGHFRGADLGGLSRLEPPVQFGFASAPATPQLVSVTTTIDLP